MEIRESFGTRSCTWILGRESFGNISEAEEGGAPRNGEGNAPLPDVTTCRQREIPFDAVLRRPIFHPHQEVERLEYWYGSKGVYGVSKQQAGRRELSAKGVVG